MIQDINNLQDFSKSSLSTKSNTKSPCLSELFGSNVFGICQLKNYLPKPMFSEFQSLINEGKPLRPDVADAVAHAVRVWAMEKGATHFTHWFQPINDSTAEKHDSFLKFTYSSNGSHVECTPMDAFSGSQLVQAESDASSFPNGGMRNTFQARGYTIWDTTSPMFVKECSLGTFVLYIPSIFISYNGEALDEKTVLLRSSQSLSRSAVNLLRSLGDSETRNVHVNLGIEQEFFLIDEECYNARLDLKQTGRTLFGNCPPKTQQLEDHYFGNIPDRILAAITDAEMELLKLGVPISARHNEVAPAQFEMAPVFEEAHIAVDHNLLTMNVLHSVAQKHKLRVLFHENPFRGVIGSGKHCNWSMSTNTGSNLLEPGKEPQENIKFLCFLVATILAVNDYSTLLRASIASCSNEHRLGAHEAPPSIISTFLGSQLDSVLNAIEEKKFRASPKIEAENVSDGKRKFVCSNGNSIDLNISILPAISRDSTDRNRTSPFAFTGNKFEFRAVGSNQSPSFPITILNCAVSHSLDKINEKFTEILKIKPILSNSDVVDCLRGFIIESKAVRFEGNGYSQNWVDEALKRGLPNISSAPEAYGTFRLSENMKLLTSITEVFSKEELDSRYHILMEKFIKSMEIEAENMVGLYQQNIFYAVLNFKKTLCETLSLLQENFSHLEHPEKIVLEKIIKLSSEAQNSCLELTNAIKTIKSNPEQSIGERGNLAHSLSVPMRSLRDYVDQLESILPDSLWPLCKYSDLFFKV